MYEKYVENFFIILLHNFPCVYTTNVEGPTIPNNLNSDKITSNCAADYFEIFLFNYSPCSVRKFVDINSYILCWNICVTIYSLFSLFLYFFISLSIYLFIIHIFIYLIPAQTVHVTLLPFKSVSCQLTLMEVGRT